ncbi:MAG: hypothetical protein GWP67_12045 [Gammaproteobacteria bacterium]|jgi:hypothetical protein|nr:hypothetical protein [Gammaproteobacteria bacterium]
MKNTHRQAYFQTPAGRGLLRVVAGVCSVAGVMAIAIAWRVAHRPDAASFVPILGWQLLIWLPWIGFYYVVGYLVRRLGTYQDASLLGLILHVFAAVLIASIHLVWFWLVSSRTSPFLDLPGTRFGAFAFFFVFWFLIDLLLYWAILARPQPNQESPEELASNATTERFAVRKGRSQHLIRTADIRWIEAQGYYAALHTDSGSFLLRRSLTRLADELDPRSFIRVHRSTIVNVAHVDGLTTNDSGSFLVTLTDGTHRGVSRSGRRRLKSVLPATA